MKKVWIEPGCTSCGMCEFICEEVFEIKEISELKKVDYSKFKEKIKEAAAMCPVSVIKYEED